MRLLILIFGGNFSGETFEFAGQRTSPLKISFHTQRITARLNGVIDVSLMFFFIKRLSTLFRASITIKSMKVWEFVICKNLQKLQERIQVLENFFGHDTRDYNF